MSPVLSVVIPVHNEEKNLDALVDRLETVLDDLDVTHEILFVDDGSRDGTYAALCRLAARPGVWAIRLARNFGKEAALSCGLDHARGQAVVLMDGDLQHPPEMIPDFYRRWRAGSDVVYGARRDRAYQSWLGRLHARAFYWMFRNIGTVALHEGAGDFRLLDRKAVEALKAMPERHRFLKGMYAWIGFRSEAVPFDVAERGAGTSKWGFVRQVAYALDALLSFSMMPLRIWTYLGVTAAGIAFVYATFRIVRALIYGVDVPGYESILVAILFMGGVQLICLGVIGEYVGRIFEESKRRPLYLVGETAGVPEPHAARAPRKPRSRAQPPRERVSAAPVAGEVRRG